MKHFMTALIKEPEQDISVPALEAVLKHRTVTTGVCAYTDAYTDDEKVEHPSGIMIAAAKEPPTLEDLQEVIASLKGNRVLFALGEGKFTDDDLQPYTVVANAEGVPQVVSIITGGVDKWEREKSDYSGFFHFNEERLKPILSTIWDAVDGDCTKFLEACKKSSFQEKAMVGTDNCTVTLLDKNGGIITYTNSKVAADFPADTEHHWWMSDPHGYVEQSSKDAEPVTKKASGLKSLLGKGKPKAAEPPAEPAPKANPPGVHTVPEVPKPDTKVDAPAEPEQYYKCPPEIKGKDNIRKAYLDGAGFIPKEYKIKPRVKVRPKPVAQTTPTGGYKEFSAAAEALKDKATAPKHLPAIPIPMVSNEERERMHVLMKQPHIIKIFDELGEEIVSPKTFQSLEGKYAPPSSQLGWDDITFILPIPFPDKVKLCTEMPHLAAMIMQELGKELVEVVLSDEEDADEEGKEKAAM